MVNVLITLLVAVVLTGLIYWATHRLAAAFGMPGAVLTVIDVILVILVVLWTLQAFGLLNRALVGV